MKKVKWSEIINKQAVLDAYEGDESINITSDNPLLNEVIENNIPFTLDVVAWRNKEWLMLVPDGGMVPQTQNECNRIEAYSLEILMPQDIILELEGKTIEALVS